jgi:hypothetical protein
VPAGDLVRDPPRDCRGLARADSREDAERSAYHLDGPALLGVQTGEDPARVRKRLGDAPAGFNVMGWEEVLVPSLKSVAEPLVGCAEPVVGVRCRC